MTKHKPCPFCGMTASIAIMPASEIHDDCEGYDHYGHDESYAVVCDASQPNGPGGCGASGGFQPTKKAAWVAWNRRYAGGDAGDR